jgi:hypothetical protein
MQFSTHLGWHLPCSQHVPCGGETFPRDDAEHYHNRREKRPRPQLAPGHDPDRTRSPRSTPANPQLCHSECVQRAPELLARPRDHGCYAVQTTQPCRFTAPKLPTHCDRTLGLSSAHSSGGRRWKRVCQNRWKRFIGFQPRRAPIRSAWVNRSRYHL